MSTTTKVLLTLVGIGGLFFLLCCGGLFFAGFKFQQFAKNAVKQDPESVREVTADIIGIDIPDDFEPKQSMDMIFMKMVIYQHKADPSATLMISQFGNQFGGDREKMLKRCGSSRTRAARWFPERRRLKPARSRSTARKSRFIS